MDPAPLHYLLMEDGRPTGPHSIAVLRQKAEVYAINADTEIAPAGEPAQWTPIRNLAPLHEVLFPAKPKLNLGPRPIEIANGADLAASPSVDDILRANIARQRVAEGELLKPQAPRTNGRKRDFIIMLAVGVILAISPWLFIKLTWGLILLSLAAIVCFGLCLVWVMFFVMDRY